MRPEPGPVGRIAPDLREAGRGPTNKASYRCCLSSDRRKRRTASAGQRDARVTTRAGDGHGSSGNRAALSRDGHLQDEHGRPEPDNRNGPGRTVIAQAGNQKESAGTATRRSPRTPHRDAPNAIGGEFHAFIYVQANPTRSSPELDPNQPFNPRVSDDFRKDR